MNPSEPPAGEPNEEDFLDASTKNHKPIITSWMGGRQVNPARALFRQAGVIRVDTIEELFGAAKLLRAPLFFVATGSMANVGGVVSAPVVASVYRRALAPVGVLMGVTGYLIGIYGGLLCAWLLSQVASGLGFIS